MKFKIFYDSLQEGVWFQELNPVLADAELLPITGNESNPLIKDTMTYDRPDIILTDNSRIILVLERTIEVPTGHNVGQRFARLASAAEHRVPLVYFGPFMARKHGGATEGPRYMNLRLFYALEALEKVNNTVATAINWPVDERFELLRGSEKDDDMREYLQIVLDEYNKNGTGLLIDVVKNAPLQKRMQSEREQFIEQYVRNPEQYDLPPPSAVFVSPDTLRTIHGASVDGFDEVLVYSVGMTYIRSDPYTGTGMLYRYLYVLGEPEKNRALVLLFPNISQSQWHQVSHRPRKDVKLFKIIADGIIFSDGYLPKAAL